MSLNPGFDIPEKDTGGEPGFKACSEDLTPRGAETGSNEEQQRGATTNRNDEERRG